MADELLTAEEVAKTLRITVRRVRALVRLKKLSYVEISPKVRIFKGIQVQDFIDSCTRTVPKQKNVDKNPSKAVPSRPKGGDKE